MLAERTLTNLYDYWSERDPQREAIYDGFRRVTNQEMNDMIKALSLSLVAIAPNKNDRVMVLLPNWYEFAVITFAAAKSGKVIVPCSISMTSTELMRQIRDMKPKVLFLSDSHLEFVDRLASISDCMIITVRASHKACKTFEELLDATMQIDRAIVSHPLDQQCVSRQDKYFIDNPRAVFAVLSTSGSSGINKYVELRYQMLASSVEQISERMAYEREDSILVPVPLSHGLGFVHGVLAPAFFGGRAVLMQKFSVDDATNIILDERITTLVGVPTIFQRLAGGPSTNNALVTLEKGMVSGAFCPESLIRDWEDKFACSLVVSYGATEAGAVAMTHIQDDLDTRATTVGRLFSGVRVKVVDTHGYEVDTDIVGELIVSGTGIMRGYVQNAENSTVDAYDDNSKWINTGDLVSIDEKGLVKLLGRKDDMIIRGGLNIYPKEIEELYLSNPLVNEAVVLAVKDNELGEKTILFVVLKSGAITHTDDLRAWATERIAKHKIPDQVVTMSEIPKLSSGKINKLALLNMLSAAPVHPLM